MTKDINELSFEEAFSELEDLVQRMETGNLSLDEALALFERGTALVTYCNDKLDAAELKVRQLQPGTDEEVDSDLSEEFSPADEAE